MGSSAKMGLQSLVFSSILLACCVVGHQRQYRDKTDRRNAFGSRPHDIVAVPDLDFAQEPQSEAQPPVRAPELKETRPEQEQEYYNYQTDFISHSGSHIVTQQPPQYQHQHQQYPVLGLQTGSVGSDNQYTSHYGASNYYVKPAVSYYGQSAEGAGNNDGTYYCRNYYGYLQPCHNWLNTIGGWWTDN